MAEIEKKHHAEKAWDDLMRQIHGELLQRQLHPSQVVVLLPYAQLIGAARGAWLRLQEQISSGQDAQAYFLPRFETTMNWTRSLGACEFGGDDLRQDAARDILTASSLLKRAGLEAHESILASRLLEAANSLARVAASIAPDERAAWGLELSSQLVNGMAAPVLALEAATAQLALAWATHSSYASDPVFSAQPQMLVMLSGFQAEPMTQALKTALGEAALVLSLVPALDGMASWNPAPETLAFHAATDAEDEAHRAAACVLTHLGEGRSPVALVAQDRVLTRRVSALLSDRGVAIQDETGWKLSTTRTAASLMGLLRALVWDASTDSVLDWLKNSPAFAAQGLTDAEISWRRLGVRDWRAVPSDSDLVKAVQSLRARLQASRPLTRWLADLRAALQTSGQWAGLQLDPAGQDMLVALRLHEGAELEFADFTPPMTLPAFTAWLGQTMEAQTFSPQYPADASRGQVVILPLSQLLGRTFAAIVLPGCDEVRLPMSPEPPGMWTPEQRMLLGLPSRVQLAEATRASWQYALQFPRVDLLWRLSEGGEQLMASGFVQALQLQLTPALAADPRVMRPVDRVVGAMPRPQGQDLPVSRLSSTAYEDLRRCPYRFFALRQLKLQTSDELESELGKRDFGNWLHSVLKFFHEALKQAPSHDSNVREAMINRASEQATLELGLSDSEFLPFAASWPRVRTAYLAWLVGHEASGAHFEEAEAWKETPMGRLTLVGKIDRIDHLADGSALVMDYKTEAKTKTAERIKDAQEDTQLAFYAALLSDDTLAGAYVNVGDGVGKDATKTYEQPEVVALRDQLLESITSDMARIEQGAAMPALGEGAACDFCAARGLCRKDFWEEN